MMTRYEKFERVLFLLGMIVLLLDLFLEGEQNNLYRNLLHQEK